VPQTLVPTPIGHPSIRRAKWVGVQYVAFSKLATSSLSYLIGARLRTSGWDSLWSTVDLASSREAANQRSQAHERPQRNDVVLVQVELLF
jgi:hypothetical protein